MRGMRESGRLAAGLLVLLAGCGGSDGDAPQIVTTSGESGSSLVETTAPRPTTTAINTTTTLPSPTEDPAELLASMNAAMAAGPSFLVDFDLHVKDSAAAATDLLTGQGTGGNASRGNEWVRGSLGAANPALTAVLEVDGRTVDGVDYQRSPFTGVWERTADNEYDAIDAALTGELELEGLSADEAIGGYVLRGQVPSQPQIEQVEVLLDRTDRVVSHIEVVSAEPRTEYANLVPAEGGPLYQFEELTARDYGADVARAVAPPDGLATSRWTSDQHPFQIQVPKDWTPASAAELTDIGATAAFYNEDLLIAIVEEDLVELGVGETTLEDYTTATSGFLTDQQLTVSAVDQATTLQGEPSSMIAGSDQADFSRFRRLVHLHDRTLGFNASFFGPKLRIQENEGLIDFILNSFLVAAA